MIRFLLNQQTVELDSASADLTVLQYLRQHQALTGSKEGCAAGDCGACTVVTAELTPSQDALQYRSINSCIALMSALHNKQLITVEHLAQNGQLHPVQSAMVQHHGSQCGYCTPGFVMSLFALYHQTKPPHSALSRESVSHALSGNLCRCTGYRPIIDAALDACGGKPADQFTEAQQQTVEALKNLAGGTAAESPLLMPHTRQELADYRLRYPEAPLVAGSTDLSLEITQKGKHFDRLISLAKMTEMHQCTNSEHSILIGAAAPLSDCGPLLCDTFPALSELLERFASLPIRNQATLGGNVANASPIGDMPPVLLALNATIIADDGKNERPIPASQFFTGYRQTTLQKQEWISRIELNKLAPNQILAAYKVSKRHEDDISAVCAVFRLTLKEGIIEDIRSGFGGVAATPVSCAQLATALVGKHWSSAETLNIGKQILHQAFSPIDDVRGSAEYRRTLLANLWHRFWLQNQPASAHGKPLETRVVTYA